MPHPSSDISHIEARLSTHRRTNSEDTHRNYGYVHTAALYPCIDDLDARGRGARDRAACARVRVRSARARHRQAQRVGDRHGRSERALRTGRAGAPSRTPEPSNYIHLGHRKTLTPDGAPPPVPPFPRSAILRPCLQPLCERSHDVLVIRGCSQVDRPSRGRAGQVDGSRYLAG